MASDAAAGESALRVRSVIESGRTSREIQLWGAGVGWVVRCLGRSSPTGSVSWESSLVLRDNRGTWVLGTQLALGRLTGAGWTSALARRSAALDPSRGSGRPGVGVSWYGRRAGAYAGAIGAGRDARGRPVAFARARWRGFEIGARGGESSRVAFAWGGASAALPARVEFVAGGKTRHVRGAVGGGVAPAGAILTLRRDRAGPLRWSALVGLRIATGPWQGSRTEARLERGVGELRATSQLTIRRRSRPWRFQAEARSRRGASGAAPTRFRLRARLTIRAGWRVETFLDRTGGPGRWGSGVSLARGSGPLVGGVRVALPVASARAVSVWFRGRGSGVKNLRVALDWRRARPLRVDVEWTIPLTALD